MFRNLETNYKLHLKIFPYKFVCGWKVLNWILCFLKVKNKIVPFVLEKQIPPRQKTTLRAGISLHR